MIRKIGLALLGMALIAGVCRADYNIYNKSIYIKSPLNYVGIGTTEPSSRLTVNGTIESLGGGLKTGDGTVADQPLITINNDAVNKPVLSYSQSFGGGGGSNLIFRDSEKDGATIIVFSTSDANFVAGTTNTTDAGAALVLYAGPEDVTQGKVWLIQNSSWGDDRILADFYIDFTTGYYGANRILFPSGVLAHSINLPLTNEAMAYSFGNSGVGLSAIAGAQSWGLVDAYISQSEEAGYEGLKVNVTEASLGSGHHRPFQVTVNNSDVAWIDNAGSIEVTGAKIGSLEGILKGNAGVVGVASPDSDYITPSALATFETKEHAAATYLTAEADTLATVTARGSMTATSVELNGGLQFGSDASRYWHTENFHVYGSTYIPMLSAVGDPYFYFGAIKNALFIPGVDLASPSLTFTDSTYSKTGAIVYNTTDDYLWFNKGVRFNTTTQSLGIYDNSANYWSFFQGATQESDITYTLPAALPASNKFLSSSSTGMLTWESALRLDQTTPEVVVNGQPRFDQGLVAGDVATNATISNESFLINIGGPGDPYTLTFPMITPTVNPLVGGRIIGVHGQMTSISYNTDEVSSIAFVNVSTEAHSIINANITLNPGDQLLECSSSFGPADDGSENLGSPSHRWNNGYINNLYGDGASLTGVVHDVSGLVPYVGAAADVNLGVHTLEVTGTIESKAGGYKFPDGSIQTTAVGSGGVNWGGIGGVIDNQTDLIGVLSTYEYQAHASSTYVPYTGATGAVTLGAQALTAGSLRVNGTSEFLGAVTLPTGTKLLGSDPSNYIMVDTKSISGVETPVLSTYTSGPTLVPSVFYGGLSIYERAGGAYPQLRFISEDGLSSASMSYNVAADSVNFADANGGFNFQNGIVYLANSWGSMFTMTSDYQCQAQLIFSPPGYLGAGSRPQMRFSTYNAITQEVTDWHYTNADVYLDSDNQKLTMGYTSKSSIKQDGTNMIINPREVGTGEMIVGSADAYWRMGKDTFSVDLGGTLYDVTAPTLIPSVNSIFGKKVGIVEGSLAMFDVSDEAEATFTMGHYDAATNAIYTADFNFDHTVTTETFVRLDRPLKLTDGGGSWFDFKAQNITATSIVSADSFTVQGQAGSTESIVVNTPSGTKTLKFKNGIFTGSE